MDEIWIRLTVIVGALGLALITTLILRFRTKGSPHRLQATGLSPGVYLFTSTACLDCRPARKTLTENLGQGFVEIGWEREPGVFHLLGVSAVPATLVVEADGSGTMFPGQPEKVLTRFGP